MEPKATRSESRAWFERAQLRIPGGVNSPVRAFKAVGGEPLFIASGAGSRLTDVDGNVYIDYVCSWGPAILGHAPAAVVERVSAAAARGLTFGAPTPLEVEFAEAIYARYPSMQLMRAVSSGTEAIMSALRVARGCTGRDAIVKFDGAYHGHSDALLVKAGSGATTLGTPDSAGVPSRMVHHTISLPYNDRPALEQLFEQRGGEIAAVIVEPVAGNMGCVPPEPGFLETILALCRRYGSISIFDEVITGCRIAVGGAQERFACTPDLTCLGKVIGGGMPLAAYGGRADLLSRVAPLGPVYQAGTLSGNPVAVSAGLATLALLDAAAYARLEAASAWLAGEIATALDVLGISGTVQRVGSMFTLFFTTERVRSWTDASQADTERFGRWHRALLERGIYWPPSQFEAAFVSTAHSDGDLEQTARAIRAALAASQT